MGGIITNLTSGDKMLCPHSTNRPIHEAHQLRTRVMNAFYEAAEKNADGEMPEPLDRAYYAADDVVGERMDLFVHRVRVVRPGEYTTVESWWWKCPTCGFVLPAQRTPA